MAGNTEYTRNEKGFIRTEELVITRTISSTAVDASNTGRTHVLQAGLMLGVITSGGEYAQYASGASDGTETAVAILMSETDLKDGNPAATAVDHKAPILIRGHVASANLILYDAAAKVDLEDTAKQIYFD